MLDTYFPNKNLKNYVLVQLAKCLSMSYTRNIFIPSGINCGKSTFFFLLKKLFGLYFRIIPVENIYNGIYYYPHNLYGKGIIKTNHKILITQEIPILNLNNDGVKLISCKKKIGGHLWVSANSIIILNDDIHKKSKIVKRFVKIPFCAIDNLIPYFLKTFDIKKIAESLLWELVDTINYGNMDVERPPETYFD